MLSADEMHWLQNTFKNVDELLRGLSDFREYPDLLVSDDENLQRYLDHVVSSVQDARTLSAKAIARLEDAQQANVEETRLATEAAAAVPVEPEPEPVVMVRPPANMEQIFMANPTGLREVVLVADHDAGSLAAVEEMLTEEDYRVLSVRDAFEAISIYARLWAAIDLVILDFSMPGLSGDLIFDELQAINPNVAAVISGGYTHPDKLSQMLARGLSGFLPKPYSREKLLKQIQMVLAHKPPSSGASRL